MIAEMKITAGGRVLKLKNDETLQRSEIDIDDYAIWLTSKEEVQLLINALDEALAYWAFDK